MKKVIGNDAGQTLILFALCLGVLAAMSALAIDVGYVYWLRSFMQRTADAGALAGASGLTVEPAEAEERASLVASQNLAGLLRKGDGTRATVTFPAPDRVRVRVENPSAGLFLAGLIGIPSAPVSAHATALLQNAGSVIGTFIPIGVHCNNSDGCQVPRDLEQDRNYDRVRRYCGNIFRDGGSGCGQNNEIQPGEIFTMALSFSQANQSNAEFRDQVYNGVGGEVSIGDEVPIAGSDSTGLSGERNGWQRGMEERLAEGRNIMTLAIVAPVGDRSTVQIVDFIAVEVTSFGKRGNTDEMSFVIIQDLVPAGSFAGPGEGLGIGSAVGARLVE